ncbi:MAG: chemotaxis protein CheV [Magnetococcales bacterium]|nr:chemotaxis protein CheV [Magnetococcales bacterium]
MDDVLSEVNQRANLAMSNELEMLTFYLTDKQLYGLNVFKIIEILECPKTVTKVPHSHPAIKGTIDFRGHGISLIDLSEAMGLPSTPFKDIVAYVLVCEYSTTTQGFLVAQPNVLIHKSWNDIIQPDNNIYESSYLTALTYDNDVAIQILDVEKLLSEIIGIDVEISAELVEQGRSVIRPDHHILAVDDSKAARTMLAGALTQMGIQHTILDNPAEALETLKRSLEEGDGRSKYTMIFTDIEMPIMDGFTLTRKVKAIEGLKDIYLAAHSSLSNKSNREKAQQMGADDFIPKFTPDRIAQAILDQVQAADARMGIN